MIIPKSTTRGHSRDDERHNRPRLTVAAVVRRGDDYLLVEETSPEGALVINQPAGHVEGGETLTEAIERELLEETGWRGIARDLVGIYHWRDDALGLNYLRFAFRLDLPDTAPVTTNIDPDIVRTGWMSANDVKWQQRARSLLVMRCIDDDRAGHRWPLEMLGNLITGSKT